VGGGAEVVDLGDVVVVEVEGVEVGVGGEVEGGEAVVGEVEGLQVAEWLGWVRGEVGELVVV